MNNNKQDKKEYEEMFNTFKGFMIFSVLAISGIILLTSSMTFGVKLINEGVNSLNDSYIPEKFSYVCDGKDIGICSDAKLIQGGVAIFNCENGNTYYCKSIEEIKQ